jgi:long-chain acyl-CoA synthetase
VGIDELLTRMAARDGAEALVHRGVAYGYADLAGRVRDRRADLVGRGIAPGDVVALRSDFTPDAVAALLAILALGGVAALVPVSAPDVGALLDACPAGGLLEAGPDGDLVWQARAGGGRHPLIESLAGAPGFVIFSSGSTGAPKAVLHDLNRFMGKYGASGKALRTLAFLLFDHIAGLDTLFYTLAAGGTLVLPEGRDVNTVCRLIESARVEVLPASPSFLNLMLLSGEHTRHDLSSLKVITYGSEPMGESLLTRLAAAFPECRIIQKYGTSEFGAPVSASRGNDSTWLKFREDQARVKVVDGVLWVKAPGTMVGYLNYPQPAMEDGWYCTGDAVEVDGEWIRILGRQSDVINVGGEKVNPADVEAAILEVENVLEAAVRGEANPMLGQVVAAVVRLAEPRDEREMTRAIRRHLRGRLAPHMVPVRIDFTDRSLVTERQKKVRA